MPRGAGNHELVLPSVVENVASSKLDTQKDIADSSLPLGSTGPSAMGRLRIDDGDELARGGMGSVHRVADPGIRRWVALKRVDAGQARRTPEVAHLLLEEAQITGQLEHPGIVPVHELGASEDGKPYYSMRFIHGRNLQSAVEAYHKEAKARGPDEVAHLRLLQVFLNLCQTVAYAHSRGVLHRDLKPENVMVGEYGETLLVDWGLAKVIGTPEPVVVADSTTRPVQLTGVTEATKTASGAIKGTPGYMSPEAADGATDQVDKVSDVYLLGATLYHILTGRPPRTGKNAVAIVLQAREKPPPGPRTLNPAIPRPLDAICNKAMAFRKADRYQSAQALAEDMQRYLAGEPVTAYREPFLEQAWRWMKKHRQTLTWAGAGVVVLAVALFGLVKWRQIEAERAEERRVAKEEQEALEARRREAQDRADLAQKQDEARGRLLKFRRLADETRFYAAIPDPIGEQAPAFRDVEGADARGRQALALVADWGPDLAGLPLPEERAALRDEAAGLMLLLAQAQARRATDHAGARDVLALLKRSEGLRAPSASWYGLRARAHRLLGEVGKAAEDQRKADDPKTTRTAEDHYLQGVAFQAESNRTGGADSEGDTGKVTREKSARQAMEQYRAALRIEPNHFWANMNLASSHFALGAPAEAAETLSSCVALRPAAPWGFALRGMALMSLNRAADARADLDRAIALSPDFRMPRLNRGVAFWVQDRLDEALADFEAVLRPPQDQRLIEGAYYKGQVHVQRGQFKEALAAFDEVTAARRAFPSLHLFRARSFLSLGDPKNALAALDRFLDPGEGYDPESAAAHGRRGRELRMMIPKLPAAAKRQALLLAHAQLEAAAKAGTGSAAVLEDLGAIQEQMGQTAKSVESYTESLRLDPKGIKTRVKRGWAQADLMPPRYDDARDDFEEALKQDPTHAEAYAGLGYVQACRKAAAEARRAAGLALLHGAGDYIVLHNVACIYAKLAQADPKQAKDFEDIALDLLRREVELWKKGGKGPNALQLIRQEPSFHKALKDRRDFRSLFPADA